MASYLARYQNGEHEQVWTELVALGPAVREEPLYTDAWAVACETMRRARLNIELLIPRLRAAGYDFGYAWLAARAKWKLENHKPLTPDDLNQMREMGVSEELLQEMAEHDGEEILWELEEGHKEHPILSPPSPNVHEQLAELESLVGAVPRSIRAWYQHVGAVDFIGTPPAMWGITHTIIPPGSQEPFYLRREEDSEGDTAGQEAGGKYQYSFQPMPLAEDRERSAQEALSVSSGHDLDPVYIYPLDKVLRMFNVAVARQDAKTVYLDLAPDEYFKYYTSGGGPYSIAVPDARADAHYLGEWHDTTFVNYLRICFRSAGIPGLETLILDATMLAALTADLLPL